MICWISFSACKEMTMADPYILYGMDASYFTRKLLRLFIYKEIPTDFRKKTLMVRAEVETHAGTHMIPVIKTPEGDWMWDTTPIAFEMDRRFPDGGVLPDAPLDRMMTRIIEDYFDEWTTRMAVFFRWNYEADIEQSGGSLARDAVGIPQDATLDAEGEKLVLGAREMIGAWARGVIQKIGVAEGAAGLAEMEGDWRRLASLLDQHFAVSDFLLGDRPALCDFSLMGALEAHFLNDPTPRGLAETHAPHLIAYAARMKAARASHEGTRPWPGHQSAPETLAPLLQHIALSFHVFLDANRQALRSGEKAVACDFGFGPRTLAARPYSEKTRADTAAEFHALDADAQGLIRRALEPLGVLGVLES